MKIIQKKQKLKIQFINSKIINQTSYKVSNELFKKKGIKFKRSLQSEINETLNVLKKSIIKNFEKKNNIYRWRRKICKKFLWFQ